jgi:hypothetical protein
LVRETSHFPSKSRGNQGDEEQRNKGEKETKPKEQTTPIRRGFIFCRRRLKYVAPFRAHFRTRLDWRVVQKNLAIANVPWSIYILAVRLQVHLPNWSVASIDDVLKKCHVAPPLLIL